MSEVGTRLIRVFASCQAQIFCVIQALNIVLLCFSSEERKLLDEERVLFVQLNWGKDVREGRFLLRREVSIRALNSEHDNTLYCF